LQGIQHYQRALLFNESADLHNNLGIALYKHEVLVVRGDGKAVLPNVTAHYQRAVELNPRMVQAHDNLGKVFRHNKTYTQALYHFGRCADLDPTSGNFKNEYAKELLRAGKVNWRQSTRPQT
jgi:Tfp pilus assembly protein PilF